MDIESGQIVFESDLLKEYFLNVFDLPEEYNYSFDDYINNCLTKNNGTLEEIKNVKRI